MRILFIPSSYFTEYPFVCPGFNAFKHHNLFPSLLAKELHWVWIRVRFHINNLCDSGIGNVPCTLRHGNVVVYKWVPSRTWGLVFKIAIASAWTAVHRDIALSGMYAATRLFPQDGHLKFSASILTWSAFLQWGHSCFNVTMFSMCSLRIESL